MASQCRQILGVLLSFLGWLGTITTCAMPMWASFLILVPVSWTAQTIIRDFHNPYLMSAQRRELGGRCISVGLRLHCSSSEEACSAASALPNMQINHDRQRGATMASQCQQILGVLLSFLGWLGTIITCAMPMWRVTAFIGANIVTLKSFGKDCG
ncbi:hypothetical protein WMY93_007680 [Mugilogobius chulae]|uniref:Claudin n=1 Tax=Mugilogobius chulae TaxID=88201 RepID=A0AAW0PPD8_9GOBI